jgi:hypothetical protein
MRMCSQLDTALTDGSHDTNNSANERTAVDLSTPEGIYAACLQTTDTDQLIELIRYEFALSQLKRYHCILRKQRS